MGASVFNSPHSKIEFVFVSSDPRPIREELEIVVIKARWVSEYSKDAIMSIDIICKFVD
jgi:hypothetical protein